MPTRLTTAFRPVLRSTLIALALGSGWREGAAAAPALEPHRAIYEVALGGARGKGGGAGSIAAAAGRIVYEFTGNACDGYALNFRQVTRIADGDGQERTMDLRSASWEDGVGGQFRFSTHTLANNVTTRRAEGTATRGRDGGLAIALKEPRPNKLDLDGDAIFPSAHMRRLLEAARSGERAVQVKVFDGSESGEKVYDTTAVIGRPFDQGDTARQESVLEQSKQAEQRRWPVSISYFENDGGDRVPVYVLRFVMYENGVSGDIAFDFPDFSLTAKLTRFEALKAEPCEK